MRLLFLLLFWISIIFLKFSQLISDNRKFLRSKIIRLNFLESIIVPILVMSNYFVRMVVLLKVYFRGFFGKKNCIFCSIIKLTTSLCRGRKRSFLIILDIYPLRQGIHSLFLEACSVY